MTRFHDLFVGLVAIVLGCLLIGGAILQNPTLMSLSKSRLLTDSLGKTATRVVIATIGVACVALGLLIASGWRIYW
jgi:hypothetical protein